MDARQYGRQPQSGDRRHQRFSWQVPVDTPPEQTPHYQQPQQHARQHQNPARLNTTVEEVQNRTFSYAQTPAEHVAFQYIPSPSDPAVPPLPLSPTPIDPRPQSVFAHNYASAQPQPHATSPAPAYQEKPPLSPLSPLDRPNPQTTSPISPVIEPPRVHTQQGRPQHARNLSSLSPINTNVGPFNMPPIPATPRAQPSDLPHKTPITPITPSSIKKEPLGHPNALSPNSRKSYAHEPYSPHNLSAVAPTSRAIFSPDSAHGPNGLDFSLHQPGQIAHPNMDLSASGTTHSWKHSLCTCTPDISTCLTGLFCPCILYGRTSYRLSQKSSKNDPTDLLSHKTPNGHCMIMAVSCGFWWLFPMVQRTRLRHMYKLEGSVLGDCVKSVCCCCCVAVQNEREIKTREEAKRQWAGPVSTEVYKSPPQMKYTPQ
ncbi:PLAC8-domain-containing protein [Lentithecium fluviatile CBS 122367]|uniref:PLAC8-domain-containing protein n=1 Tax=Lentithecium fluviatile CBS 122367 TaxID=1168545 RepID=A0A6G1IV39_9PLEO|nr:PLAC8-domain-containing protein [Lentithecium fluviatile CBS 122367]